MSWLVRDCSEPRSKTLSAYTGPAMASVERHKNLHLVNRSWSARAQFFVQRIPKQGAHVLDMGAGAVGLRHQLLATGSIFTYTPVDAVDRHDTRMRICQLNMHEYPLRISPPPTHLVLQGVLEYMYDKMFFLRSLRCAYPNADVLLSYNVAHKVGEYESHGWVGPLTEANLREVSSPYRACSTCAQVPRTYAIRYRPMCSDRADADA